MSHPFQSRHRQGVVGVLVRQQRLLVIRRSRFVVAPSRYCFPGGGVEPGESERQALARELDEELGVAVEPLQVLWRSVTPWKVSLAWWLAEIGQDAHLAANRQEVESIHWVTPEEMGQLNGLLESNLHFLEAWRRGEFQLPLR